MPNARKPALLTTVHDPVGRYRTAFAQFRPLLADYDAIFAATTDETAADLVRDLRESGIDVNTLPAGRVGDSLRDVVRVAVNAGHQTMFYCDFDRWLHWARTFPHELMALPETVATRCPNAEYVCLGRTPRAFATHPEVQQRAEAATNRALSLMLTQELDATAGACWMSRRAAIEIWTYSIERTKATDLEWPAIVSDVFPSGVAGLELDGLEFETASFYSGEVRAVGGLDAWITQTYDRPETWRDRLQLAADSVAALARVLATDRSK